GQTIHVVLPYGSGRLHAGGAGRLPPAPVVRSVGGEDFPAVRGMWRPPDVRLHRFGRSSFGAGVTSHSKALPRQAVARVLPSGLKHAAVTWPGGAMSVSRTLPVRASTR